MCNINFQEEYMEKRMTVLGSSIRIGVLGFPYFVLTIVLSRMYQPLFNISFISEDAMFIAGLTLLIIGVSVDGDSAARIVRAVENKRLATDGAYSICPNPMYASKVFLSIPGIGLMLGSWLVLTAAVVVFILFKLLINYEEEYLRRTFGQEYVDYRRRVLIKFL
jgi:protein-S-isoprenylcysteine O-methyltransferase Ste14